MKGVTHNILDHSDINSMELSARSDRKYAIPLHTNPFLISYFNIMIKLYIGEFYFHKEYHNYMEYI